MSCRPAERTRWCGFHPEVDQFAHSCRQSTANLPQAVRRGQLTKEHRYQLLPTGEAFRRPLGSQLMYRAGKMVSVDHRNYLCKHTGNVYHSLISGNGFCSSVKMNIPDSGDVFRPISPTYFGQEWFERVLSASRKNPKKGGAASPGDRGISCCGRGCILRAHRGNSRASRCRGLRTARWRASAVR